MVLSDPCIAVDLLEKRSHKYSSRSRLVVMGELYWDGASILVQPYGKPWLNRRRLLHQALSPPALKLYKPTQEAEATRLCAHLLDSPKLYEKHIDRFTSSVVFTIAYGHRVDSLDANIIKQRLGFMHYAASLNVPGAYLAESMPFLKHIPSQLAPWKREIQDRGREEASANMALVKMVERDIEAAKKEGYEAPPSLCKLLLEIRDKESVQLSNRDFSFVPGSLFGAGSDTTASTLCTAFLAMTMNPSVLSLAHKELDVVIGSGHCPTLDDEPRLPYMRALCKEVLRWRPVAVMGGTPHASTENDDFLGYRIPGGTTILSNSWAINHNEDYYPESQLFDPIRFFEGRSMPEYLSEKEKDMERLRGKSHPSKSGHSSFGWGRRICPGAGLAENSLFAALSKIVWTFDILAIPRIHYDTYNYTDGFNIRPRPFECVIRPRGDEYRRVIFKEMNKAEQWLSRFPCFEE